MIAGKNVLLCVTGGIAVFKATALTSKLVQAGANVKVAMSKSAKEFVTPLTFQTLSRNIVYDDTFSENDPKVVAHIDIADWADVVVVAPATANMIGKLANGIADDMISTTLLATTAPVLVAPAMNVHMYEHPAVERNMKRIQQDGYQFIEPNEGYLACGYVGKGRLAEPEDIVAYLTSFFAKEKDKPLQNKHVLITAGPTQEKIDPVRFISNHSSGKMGYALAKEAVALGANVTLISGPSSLDVPKGVAFVPVVTAEEMYEAVIKAYPTSDFVIKSAAVSDYRPKQTYSQKVKKQEGPLSIEFERTLDILKTLGENKRNQMLVGFAAESQQVEHYAKDKLKRKNLDMIIANDITEKGAGFGSDTNRVLIITEEDVKPLPLLPKQEVAAEIWKEIIAHKGMAYDVC
ncbi:bifunctional phosphopantothenoylcysteine decarboxylase/phosphopantothenate--cysteine ligase CoaBC [Alkalihalobacillus sp. LMS39]|uniref:bifunctional phosphopantothenoylcysteine decarboxylase/phosphopantothenate--cysteine ligase CoaBC n=1 Tax=Alkalihalobacillus sp. LMS39 TaxID=2924032 RepID=UPI001FB54007|nr:bifunctional phosphopantothenoylcysteine decarboxylase/phosphopantothenate--cysteine ligase CoaBC [Alkalihalobacillus sp. LMS39]UOE92891.1 bifunctional phosphopantothenoylcysteine decarboxylase/phosphopantothenate--cysteine ligase CoaBC [Alkalihalobacillus sp. LMS39]